MFVWAPSSQWGYADDVGDMWVGLSFDDMSTALLDGRIPGAGRSAGFVFDASLFQSLPPEPQITAFTFSALYSVPVFDAGGGPDNSIELWIVPDPTPADYASGSLAPGHRGEVSLGTMPLSIDAFPESQRADFTLDAAALAIVQTIVSDPAWAGRIALTLRATGANTLYVQNGPSYAATVFTEQQAAASAAAYDGDDQARSRYSALTEAGARFDGDADLRARYSGYGQASSRFAGEPRTRARYSGIPHARKAP